MPIYDISGLSLVELELEELDLAAVMTSLMLGDILVIKGYEDTRGKDILVKLDNRKHQVTHISFDVDPITFRDRYWMIHNVSLNALSLQPVYRYDEYTYSMQYKYNPRDVVQIDTPEGVDSVYLVSSVLVSPDKEVYYTLEGIDGYYTEAELIPYSF